MALAVPWRPRSPRCSCGITHACFTLPQATGEGEESTQLLVVLPEAVIQLPDDEDMRWDALASYNILDTV